jgi:hypothetical protein
MDRAGLVGQRTGNGAVPAASRTFAWVIAGEDMVSHDSEWGWILL